MSAADTLLAWISRSDDARYRSVSTLRRDGELCIQFKIAIFTSTRRYSRPKQPDVAVAIYDQVATVMGWDASAMARVLAKVEAWADASLIDPDAPMPGESSG